VTDFVLHIGLSKCGSTSIQWDLLSQPNFLGRGVEADRYGNRLTRDFLRLSPINRIPSFGRLEEWCQKAYDHVSYACGGTPSSCVLSSEVLSKPIKSSYEPLLDFLEKLDKTMWPWGRVKVIVVIRAQGPRIASLHAQNSHLFHGAGQRHFEAFVDKSLENDFSLEYYAFIRELIDQLEPSNVLCLLLEEIRSYEFWCDLRKFAGCQLNPTWKGSHGAEVSNKRSQVRGSWEIRDPLERSISRGVANSILLWGWPQSLFPGLRLFSRNTIAGLDQEIRRFRFRNDHARSLSIELTSELDSKIRKHYSSSNNDLQLLLGKDLKSFGYI
jgi:hypothetical protein